MIFHLLLAKIYDFCKYVRLWKTLCVCLFVCLHRDTGRNFHKIITKLSYNIDVMCRQRCIVFRDLRLKVTVNVT
jgi:hypothetical protein